MGSKLLGNLLLWVVLLLLFLVSHFKNKQSNTEITIRGTGWLLTPTPTLHPHISTGPRAASGRHFGEVWALMHLQNSSKNNFKIKRCFCSVLFEIQEQDYQIWLLTSKKQPIIIHFLYSAQWTLWPSLALTFSDQVNTQTNNSMWFKIECTI